MNRLGTSPSGVICGFAGGTVCIDCSPFFLVTGGGGGCTVGIGLVSGFAGYG